MLVIKALSLVQGIIRRWLNAIVPVTSADVWNNFLYCDPDNIFCKCHLNLCIDNNNFYYYIASAVATVTGHGCNDFTVYDRSMDHSSLNVAGSVSTTVAATFAAVAFCVYPVLLLVVVQWWLTGKWPTSIRWRILSDNKSTLPLKVSSDVDGRT